MGSPRISVVMSVFNGERFLSEAIESILEQTIRDFEFVIVDDGSTDRTPEILSDFANRDGRIRILSHANKGRAVSLNLGISMAKGELIARMDADDVSLPRRFEEQLDFMDQHPEVLVLGGAVELIDTKGQALHSVRRPSEDADIRVAMLTYCPVYHSSVTMRKKAMLAVGGYRKALLDADDYDLWLRMTDLGRIANLQQVILRYRLHADQVSIRGMRQQTLCTLAARASANLRARDLPDPLSNATEVTPEVLDALGVCRADVQSGILRSYCNWIEVLERTDPRAALQITQEFLVLADPKCIGRTARANAWIKAAEIHWRQGRHVSSLLSAVRALLTRPIIAGRPLKKVLLRITEGFSG